MNELKIEKSISELLYQYDCVIVPDLGGFVGNYCSAKIHPIRNTFTPPSKQISFNRNLTNNDGLLANYISNQNEMSFVEARKLIDGFVNQTVASLSQGNKVGLDKIGTLYLDPEKNLQFSPDYSVNYLRDAYGLGEFKAQAILREKVIEVVEKQIKEKLLVAKTTDSIEEKSRVGFYWAAAASVLILAGVGYTTYKYQQQNSFPMAYASFGWNSVEALYSPKVIEKNDDFQLEVPETIKESEPIIKENTTLEAAKSTDYVVEDVEKVLPNKNNTDLFSTYQFHVVGGCFSSENNAKKLVRQLTKKGYQAEIIGQYKNLYTVSYQSFNSRDEAYSLLDKIRNSDNPSAWLLEK